MASNAVLLVLTLYLVSNVCMILLACRTFVHSVRLSLLDRRNEFQTLLLEKLKNLVAEQADAIEELRRHTDESCRSSDSNSDGSAATAVATTEMRHEIELLISDLISDKPRLTQEGDGISANPQE